MNPLSTMHGKTYYAIRCGNPECRHDLALVEIPELATPTERRAARDSVPDVLAICPMCTGETPVRERPVTVLDTAMKDVAQSPAPAACSSTVDPLLRC